MSEDQQQPASADDQTPTPPLPSTASEIEADFDEPIKTTKPTPNQEQPFLRSQSIKLLRGTIGRLEGVVERLEAEPIVAAPTLEDTPTARSTKPGILKQPLPTLNKVQAFWAGTLARVRSLLPEAWNEKLSDWALTGAIAGVVVVVLWTSVALLSPTPKPVAEVPPKAIATSPELTTPETVPPELVPPELTAPATVPLELTTPEAAPPELTTPEAEQPLAATPPPPPTLTPEQNLVASVQAQVAEIIDQYGEGLIQSLQADFLESRLVVKVSDDWYNLQETQQNNLADEILQRSQELDFSRLEIADLDGTLLARNPVVGSTMVILQREELAGSL